MRKLLFVAALALLVTGTAFAQPLYVGTGAFGNPPSNPTFELDPDTDTSTQVFTGFAFWGATWDAANDRLLFTTNNESAGTANDDGADLMAWTVGGTPALIGTITVAGSGVQLRIDGLAISGGTLYGVHQFDDGAGTAGIYSIDTTTFEATFEAGLTSGAVSGIDADPSTGLIYGVDDTAGQVVEIDPGTFAVSNVAPYPATKTDIDGLGVCGDGIAYLVPDDGVPGEIFPLDIATGTYGTSLTSPLVNTDTFSGGACFDAGFVPPDPILEIPTLSQWGLILISLLLLGAGITVLRRR